MKRSLLIGLLMSIAAGCASESPVKLMTSAPDGWTVVSAREEVAASSSVIGEGSDIGLVLAGTGNSAIDSRWTKRMPLPEGSAGKFVSLTARYRSAGLDAPGRQVFAAVVWYDEAGKRVDEVDVAAPAGPADAKGYQAVKGLFKVPAKAKQAEINLWLRWTAKGEVEWRDAKLVASETPAPRKIKVASVNHRPRGTKSVQQNLEQFGKYVDEAGAKKPDIVCLPEAITLIGRGTVDYVGCAESVPGPTTEFLGQVAKRNNCYIVAGIYEREGKAAYNTAVLIGRDGSLVGKFRKVCLPFGESHAGLVAGQDYPVFDTDFGKVGLMICWDISYPEVARGLADRGAELFLLPIWGGSETLVKARALENQVPIVISGFDIRSAVYDAAGEQLAKAPDASSCVVYADLDFTLPARWPGRWHERLWVEGPARAGK